MEAVKSRHKAKRRCRRIHFKFRVHCAKCVDPVVEPFDLKDFQVHGLKVALKHVEFCHGISEGSSRGKHYFAAALSDKITLFQHSTGLFTAFRTQTGNRLHAPDLYVLIIVAFIDNEKVNTQNIEAVRFPVHVFIRELIAFFTKCGQPVHQTYSPGIVPGGVTFSSTGSDLVLYLLEIKASGHVDKIKGRRGHDKHTALRFPDPVKNLAPFGGNKVGRVNSIDHIIRIQLPKGLHGRVQNRIGNHKECLPGNPHPQPLVNTGRHHIGLARTHFVIEKDIVRR